MLPFLNNKKNDVGIAGTIIKNRTPDQPQSDSDDDSTYDPAECAKDMIHAIKTNDHELFASALGEFIDNHGQEDSDESSPSPHTYDAQNQEAAE